MYTQYYGVLSEIPEKTMLFTVTHFIATKELPTGSCGKDFRQHNTISRRRTILFRFILEN